MMNISMINYANIEMIVDGCFGCAYDKHEFELPCGIAYENERFIVSQDWKLPIPGFLIVSPKKHIEKLEELIEEEGMKCLLLSIKLSEF